MTSYGQSTRRARTWTWLILILVLLAAALGSGIWAIHSVREMERAVLGIEPGRVVIRPTPALLHDLDACHRRIDAIDATIVAIENRRGNEPPRTLAEQRAYRRVCVGVECAPSVYAEEVSE